MDAANYNSDWRCDSSFPIYFLLSFLFFLPKKKLKWTKNELRILEKARALKLFDFKGMKFSKIVEIIR